MAFQSCRHNWESTALPTEPQPFTYYKYDNSATLETNTSDLRHYTTFCIFFPLMFAFYHLLRLKKHNFNRCHELNQHPIICCVDPQMINTLNELFGVIIFSPTTMKSINQCRQWNSVFFLLELQLTFSFYLLMCHLLYTYQWIHHFLSKISKKRLFFFLLN